MWAGGDRGHGGGNGFTPGPPRGQADTTSFGRVRSGAHHRLPFLGRVCFAASRENTFSRWLAARPPVFARDGPNRATVCGAAWAFAREKAMRPQDGAGSSAEADAITG